ncbi:phosphoglycerate kinase [bacterium]|nr:phosphoglycerate kinase [bacterium]
MSKMSIRDLDLTGSRVLTRVDFNVPLSSDGRVSDDTRIRRALPTIEYIVERGGKAVLMSHLGRPNGEQIAEMSLRPAAERLSQLLGRGVTMAPDCVGDSTEGVVARMHNGDVVLLENLRFHRGETKNELDFSRRLARLGDVYVNDAFGTAHRAHASTVGITQCISKSAMGFLIENELSNLRRAIDGPAKPYIAILGGAKVSDKIGVIENLMSAVDVFLIGGGMAFTFLKAQGGEIGDSLVEDGRTEAASAILESARRNNVTFVLPTDVVVTREIAAGASSKTVDAHSIQSGWRGVDIGEKTTRAFVAEIAKARTIVWNGPLGVFETEPFDLGTIAVARAVAEATEAGATSIVGGGDSAAALVQAGIAGRVSHVSTGGGASLAFLEGKPLPAVVALTDAPCTEGNA